jgi:DNA-binding MarR family transcriptional regulator
MTEASEHAVVEAPTEHSGSTTTADCIEELARILPRLSRIFKAQLRGGQLTPQQMYALMEIGELCAAHADGTQPGELARRLCITSPAVTALLDDLVTCGYCDRAHSDKDRRKVLVRLTPSGSAMLAQVRAGASGALREALTGWSEERVCTLHQLLHELSDAADANLARSHS